jgi:histidine kinase/DNA gyrase B/HSP90-like ATPase/uncharacterized protein DUF4145
MPIKSGILTPREPAIDLVRIISEGTYTSFPQALKEFISNAYDADATRLDIRVDEDCGTIAIRDNGVGMTLADFRDFFASIGRPGKSGSRAVRGKTVSGRQKIGRFGIGSLAIVGAADKFTVRSSRRASGEGFEASIDLKELRKHFHKGEDLSKYWLFPYEQWSGEPGSNHFTEVRIEGISPEIREILRRPGEKTTGEFFERVSQLSGLDELSWQLGLICPVAYLDTYPVEERFLNKSKDKVIFDEARRLLRANFKLFLNGHEVRRQISLPSYPPNKLRDEGSAELLEKRGLGFEVRSFRAPARAPVFYQGYLVVQASQVFPEDIRGLLIRLRGTAIGWHRTLNIATAGLSTMLPSLSGEVWVDGLEEALQFDRESFREDHPDFRWLREQLVKLIGAEAPEFRERSARRKGKEKASKARKAEKPAQPAAPAGTGKATAPVTAVPSYPTDSYLPASIFDAQRAYLTRLVPQINGCWSSGYYEACAVMSRRLIETMIIELYNQHGWVTELKDPTSKDFLGLKALVNKISSDPRLGFDSKFQKGLKALKELGDIAAHDYRVQIKKSDLEDVRSDLRFTCERMVFEISRTITP